MNALLVALLVLAGGDSNADSAAKLGGAGPYFIRKEVIAAGGTTLPTPGGPYTLAGTVAESAASARVTAGPYTLSGGFWNSPQNGVLFANGFEAP